MAQRQLSARQRKYCEGIIAGLSGIDAYAAAYPNASKATVRSRAYNAGLNPMVKAEIQSMRDKADAMAGSAVMSLIEKRKMLARLVRLDVSQLDEDKDGDLINGVRFTHGKRTLEVPCKLRAIQIDNDLAGVGAEAAGNQAVGGLAALVKKLRV